MNETFCELTNCQFTKLCFVPVVVTWEKIHILADLSQKHLAVVQIRGGLATRTEIPQVVSISGFVLGWKMRTRKCCPLQQHCWHKKFTIESSVPHPAICLRHTINKRFDNNSLNTGAWSTGDRHVKVPRHSSSSPVVLGDGATASAQCRPDRPDRPETDRKDSKSAPTSKKSSPSASSSGANPSVEFKKPPNSDRYVIFWPSSCCY